ncbi:MAG: hypothetical protein FVQ79_08335 [Planctomycetes bacterium]|nr:hypothetical protein [Planctomycetota bacterium]
MVKEKDPCADGLTAGCFAQKPAWARQAFAFRLMNVLAPPPISRRLLKAKWKLALFFPPGWEPGDKLPGYFLTDTSTLFPDGWTAGDPLPPGIIIDPGVIFPPEWTPGDELPPGITIDPGVVFPPGWTPGDELPPGITIDPGVVFPPGWTPGDELPPGAEIDTGEIFPPGWTPGDELPPGIIPDPSPLLPGDFVPGTDPTPPIYGPPFTPGPVHPPGESPPGLETYIITFDGGENDGNIDNSDNTFTLARDQANNAAEYSYHNFREYSTMIRWNVWGIEITRSFFIFDLSSIPAGAVVSAATLRLRGYVKADTQVSVQQGTQNNPMVNGDFSGFAGNYFGLLTWAADGGGAPVDNDFALNAAGIAYIQSVIGANAKFCMRDYTYDYTDTDPGGTGYDHQNGCFYADIAQDAKLPKLIVTYEV